MGLRGPRPASDEERRARDGRDRRVRFRVEAAKTAWRSRAERLEVLGLSLVEKAIAKKTPHVAMLKAGLEVLEASDALWMRLHRAGGDAPPAPPRPTESLEAFRRRRAPVPRVGE